MMSNREKQKREKWIKFTERECDLFTAYCIMTGYLKYYQKNIGVNFKNFLMVNNNGIILSWRLQAEYESFLASLKRKKLQTFEKLLDKLHQQATRLQKFLKYSHLDKCSDANLSKKFSYFVNVYQSYFALFTLPKYFGMVLNQDELPLRVKNKLAKTRGIADYEDIQNIFLSRIFNEIGKRNKIDGQLLFYALPEEIKGLLRGMRKIDNKILVQRKKIVAFLAVNGGEPKIITGEKVKKILKLNNIADTDQDDCIKGSTANTGIVVGAVKLVLRRTDLKNLKDKIVVSPMTSIKFTPHLKSVRGIITNEGGIACHAAIISRELGIPCIVGTKNATRVLKNGDFVELDANNGLVNILKRT